MSKIKSKREYNFIGILANVDESILKINDILEHGFEIKQISTNDCVRIYSKYKPELITEHRLFENKCMDKKLKTYYFHKSFEGEVTFDSKNINRIIFRYPDNFNELSLFFINYLDSLMKLMRLFKEGNIQMPFSFYYYKEKNIPFFSGLWGGPQILKNNYSLNDSEILELKSFLKDFDLNINEKPLKLAFENYELSYGVDNLNLRFLTLVNALEVLLKPSSAQTDLNYRLSRNAAVLLGKDEDGSDKIYKELKCLYAIRSSIVHVGEPKECEKKGKKRKTLDSAEMNKHLACLKDYIRESIKEMNFIIKKEGKNKDQILKMLNKSGFGKRSWRED